MKILFIGGTGVISSACSQLAVSRGIDLYLLNRGQSSRPTPEGAYVLQGDVSDRDSFKAALKGHSFDVVVDWIAYTPDQVEADIQFFRDKVGQYVFISSASAYQKPPASLPVTESTVLNNPFWEYSRNKIACEERLVRAYREEKFPTTIVRPSHTYDKTLSPIHGGYTVIDRMRSGQPVIVQGDGTSLWVLTHHTDFAKGFIGLLGNPHAIGDAFQITSDEILTWNQIYEITARAAGAEPHLVHVPSELITVYDPVWGASLIGDKSHSVIFDNTKIKRIVPDYQATIPYSQGAVELIAWFDSDPANQVVDPVFNGLIEKILSAYQLAWP